MKKLLFLLLISFTLDLVAQDLDTFNLEEVKIISTQRIKAPITYKLLSKNEIDFVNVGQEPSYILNNTPSITNYSDNGSNLGYTYFRLRGVDQTRINMTLDGIPLNESEDQGCYFSNYPDFFNNINSLQIQRGVGTSSNGVSSYIGSINFESPLLTDDKYHEFNVNYGSFNTYRLNYKYNSSVNNNKGIYISLSKLSTDGYKYHSDNESKTAFISFGYFKNKNIFKITSWIGNQQNNLAWLGVTQNDINKDRKINGCTDREKDNFTQGLIKILWLYNINKNSNLNTTIYYNRLNGNYDFDLNNFLKLPLDNTLYNYHFIHNFTGLFTTYSYFNNKNKFYTGYHINTFNRQHIGSELIVGELYKNKGIKNEIDYFIKDIYDINNISIFGDIQYRYTYFDYNGLNKLDKIKWNFINWRTGLNYKLNNKIDLYYTIGKSFREPTRNDIFLGNDDLLVDSLNNNIIGSTSAEEVLDNEIGIKINNDYYHLYFNYYYMYFNNEIVLNGKIGPNGLLLHSNVAKSYRSGIELDLQYEYLDFTFSNNSNYSINNIKENNINIIPVLTPNLIINQDITYYLNKMYFNLNFKYQDDSYLDFSNLYKINSYYTFNLKFTYIVNNNEEYGININNIFNKKYNSYGLLDIYNNPTFFVAAPFNFNFYLKWNF